MDAVDILLEARHSHRPLSHMGSAAPADVAAGYAVQRRLAERLAAVPPAGFKIGATTAQMQKYLGLDGPVAGFVPGSSLNRSGFDVPFGPFNRPGVECEIAVRLGMDLPFGPCDPARAAAAVAAVMPAIEIVENRYADLAAFGTPSLIADQIFHAGGVLGEELSDWRGLDLDAVHGELFVDGVSRGSGHGRDLLGGPMRALAWLASSGAAEVFGGLKAGQVIWLGSVTPPIWLDGPCAVRVRFSDWADVELTFH